MSLIDDRAVWVTADGINKTLKNAIQDGDIGGPGGASPVEIFNFTMGTRGTESTITGAMHFRAPQGLTISSVVIQIYEKNGVSSGTLTVDIKKNTSPNDVGMTSIFSAAPSFDFSTAADYATSSGTISTSSVSSGNYLRVDVTSIPSGWAGYFQVMVYA